LFSASQIALATVFIAAGAYLTRFASFSLPVFEVHKMFVQQNECRAPERALVCVLEKVHTLDVCFRKK
jgi:hypothetical protein